MACFFSPRFAARVHHPPLPLLSPSIDNKDDNSTLAPVFFLLASLGFFLNQHDKDWKKVLKGIALVKIAILAEKGDGIFYAVKMVPFF